MALMAVSFSVMAAGSLLRRRTFMFELPDVIREERNVFVERSA